MIFYLLTAVVLVLAQVGFANLLSFGFSSLFPFLVYLVMLLYLDLPRPLINSLITVGLMLDIFSTLKFGNFLFILLAVFLLSAPLFATKDELNRRVRSLILIFLASIILQLTMLHGSGIAWHQLIWPLLLTGTLNCLLYYLILILTKKLIANE